jgi:hypothetical protein
MSEGRSSRSEAHGLIEIVVRIIDIRRDEGRIGPSWVATEAMRELDPYHAVERQQPLVWLGCHLELRQLARGVLGRRFDPEKTVEPTADDLFPDLQWRYPEARSATADEPIYILRDLMSDADVGYNVARLRAEAAAKNRHADALEAWHRRRR